MASLLILIDDVEACDAKTGCVLDNDQRGATCLDFARCRNIRRRTALASVIDCDPDIDGVGDDAGTDRQPRGIDENVAVFQRPGGRCPKAATPRRAGPSRRA
ncbi:MAG: hypothetical protein U5O39_15310 [Gammaproteobacteria bacterium]|nr:hypothetical protein [Gammaproteobacteria bacterium]